MVLILIWRVWNLRTDLLHGKDQVPVKISVDFLNSYLNSLWHAKKYNTEEMIKGKMVERVGWSEPKNKETASARPWPAPATGWVALSVDGSFSSDGTAGSGMVLRNPDGSLIFAAYRHLFFCNEALEAELHAIREGLALALERSDLPMVIQSDSSMMLSSLSSDILDRSAYGHLVTEIKHLLAGREFFPTKVSRDQNRVADHLANHGRVECSTACWLQNCPSCIPELLPADCNSASIE